VSSRTISQVLSIQYISISTLLYDCVVCKAPLQWLTHATYNATKIPFYLTELFGCAVADGEEGLTDEEDEVCPVFDSENCAIWIKKLR